MSKESDQPCEVYANSSGEKRDIVSDVEAVPEGAEEEDGQCAAVALIDDKAQPVCCRFVPVVQQHLQT